MRVDLDIGVHHLTRVEGHGNIDIRIEAGTVTEARWHVVETPRFFEVMLKGKHFSTAGILAARICGICSISHCLASLRATEAALGVTVPPRAAKLRLLAKHAETLQSHALHVFLLAAPDFFGLPSALALLDQESKAYDLARRIRGLAGRLAEAAGGLPLARDRAASAAPPPPQALAGDIERALVDLAATVAPGMPGPSSARLLMQKRPEVFHIARRVKGLANRMSDAVAGRTTHPVSLQPGGVAVEPERRVLEGFRQELEASVPDLATSAELFATFEIPGFTRETEFVSLGGGGYPFIGGSLVSSDGVVKTESDYLAMTNEYTTEENTTKWSRLSREAYAVGALARVNNNAAALRPEARVVAKSLGLEPVCHNPFVNNVAQLVEMVHVAHEMLVLLDELIDDRSGDIRVGVTPRAGDGVGAVEAPRGILFHHYEYDRQGRIVRADCVVPTTQNNANIHFDLRALAGELARGGMTDRQAELLCSMLVRAYDPCISCSVH